MRGILRKPHNNECLSLNSSVTFSGFSSEHQGILGLTVLTEFYESLETIQNFWCLKK